MGRADRTCDDELRSGDHHVAEQARPNDPRSEHGRSFADSTSQRAARSGTELSTASNPALQYEARGGARQTERGLSGPAPDRCEYLRSVQPCPRRSEKLWFY